MKPYLPRIKCHAISLALAMALGGCAVQYTPVHLDLAPVAAAPARTLAQDTNVVFDTGYARQLKAGSSWKRVGALPQGDVYRPVDDIFMVQGSHNHEAYLIVRDGMLTGFYLPAEGGFSALGKPQALRFTPE